MGDDMQTSQPAEFQESDTVKTSMACKEKGRRGCKATVVRVLSKDYILKFQDGALAGQELKVSKSMVGAWGEKAPVAVVSPAGSQKRPAADAPPSHAKAARVCLDPEAEEAEAKQLFGNVDL